MFDGDRALINYLLILTLFLMNLMARIKTIEVMYDRGIAQFNNGFVADDYWRVAFTLVYIGYLTLFAINENNQIDLSRNIGGVPLVSK